VFYSYNSGVGVVKYKARGCNIPCMPLSLGPHDAYFRMRALKPQVAKASTVTSVMRDK